MNEVRLVDANALKEELEISKYIIPNDLNKLLNSEINRCIEAIDNAPTVEIDEDVAKEILNKRHLAVIPTETLIALQLSCGKPRPKGKWELHGMIWYCSNCGKDCEQGGNNFCGQCGAEMIKEIGDDTIRTVNK